MGNTSVPAPYPAAVPARWRLSAALLVAFAVFTALYIARAVFLPITLALVLSFVLSPMVGALQRLRLPRPAAAALALGALIGILVGSANLLAEPARQWMERAPELTERFEQRLETVASFLRKFTRATEKVEALAESTGTRDEVQVTVQGPSLRGLILTSTWELAAGAAVLIFLLYFLLASGDVFLRRMVQVLPTFQQKRIAVTVARCVRTNVTRYLLTVTLINTALGLVVYVAMAQLGMPNPALWGMLAAVLNFIPYLGPSVVVVVVAAVALLTFDSFASAMVRPLTFLTLTTLEGQLITPYILGQRLRLQPVVIFVGLIFWAWLWGIPGALLAVPLTMTIKIICDAIPSLAHIGTFMSR